MLQGEGQEVGRARIPALCTWLEGQGVRLPAGHWKNLGLEAAVHDMNSPWLSGLCLRWPPGLQPAHMWLPAARKLDSPANNMREVNEE